MPKADDPHSWGDQGRRIGGLFRVGASADAAQWSPNTDVYETRDGLVVRMEIAGARREDLNIEVANRILVVRGTRPEPEEECCPGRVFGQAEVEYGPFARTVPIPRWADPEQVDAQYRGGFLTIRILRVREPEKQRIPIQLADD